ncbi:response regulator transcription factor [Gordonia sp. DT30]|uniref:response regulator transcription factor n=1 Tax=unclassified Gordonia (in: high G+C Gram-positive bacteria) TaxID=2657482 RepID=UPI003CF4F704
MTIRVALVDDQELVRMGLRMILDEADGIEVVGEASDGEQAVALVDTCRPDVVLMDVRMPLVDGVEATRRVVAHAPQVAVLVLTTFDLDEYAFAAIRAGAAGFLLKDVRGADLVAAVAAVARGDAVVSPRITRALLDTFVATPDATATDGGSAGAGVDVLTDREQEVVAAVARGLSNQEIAAELYVSETTIKSHVAHILAKLDLRNRIHVVIYAYEHGLAGRRG